MVQFLINRNQPLAGAHRFGSEQFARPACKNAFGVRHSFQDFRAKTCQLAVLFGDMSPALVGQTNRYAVARSNSLNQGSLSRGIVSKQKGGHKARPYGLLPTVNC